MCKKLLFTLFFTIHMPWCNVHVSLTVHQTLVLKKKKPHTNLSKCGSECGSKPTHRLTHNKKIFKKNPRLIPSLIKQT